MKVEKIVALCAVIGLLGQSGCSVVMAARQPPKRDLSVLSAGSPRSLVLAEFGQPLSTTMRDGERVDVFSFTQGYNKVAKGGRALAHGALDVFTLGLWEVVGTPTEMVFDGTKMAFEVTYDAGDQIKDVVDVSKQAQ
jgi:hypothetical protein